MTLIEDERLTEAEHAWYHALLSDLDPPTLEELAVRPAWMTQAACRGMGPETFFPELGDSLDPARAVCATCTVRGPCLDAALSSMEHGVWAGTSARERVRMGRGEND